MTSFFSSGNTSAITSSMPSFLATASAVARLSPVSMMIRRPSACSRRMASGVEARIGSATPSSPASLPSTAISMTVCPSPRRASNRGSDCVHGDALIGHERRIAQSEPVIFHDAKDALAGDRLDVLGLRKLDPLLLRSFDDGGGQRMFAGAFQAGGQAQQCRLPETLEQVPP